MKVGGGGLILFNLCLKKYFYEKLMQISYRYSSFGLNCSIAVLKEKKPTYFLKYQQSSRGHVLHRRQNYIVMMLFIKNNVTLTGLNNNSFQTFFSDNIKTLFTCKKLKIIKNNLFLRKSLTLFFKNVPLHKSKNYRIIVVKNVPFNLRGSLDALIIVQ